MQGFLKDMYGSPRTFSAFKKNLDSLSNQQDGRSGPVCETGGQYREFVVAMLARPGDEAIIEDMAVGAMARDIDRYFDGRHGRIYWRIRLEWEIEPTEVVIRYAKDGPDMDFFTDQKCFKNKNWIGVKAYCRVFREIKRDVKAA